MSKRNTRLTKFQESVVLKYQIYSALFSTLPFSAMKDMDPDILGFQEYARREMTTGKSPDIIVNNFLNGIEPGLNFQAKTKILFLILQFLERQVVLLDALEKAAFPLTHDMNGIGSLSHLLRSLGSQKRIQELTYKNTLAASLPKLTAFGTAGTNNSQADYIKLYSTPYYSYGYVGARLSIPIFSGLNKYYQQQSAKIGIQKAQNNLQMMENNIDLQIRQSHIMLQNNLANIKSQKRNLELAEQVIRITKIKFNEGVGSNLEVVDAENSFKTAQTNYYNAVYDALVSLIDYQKATGSLYAE